MWSGDGILFDGVDNFLKASAFTLEQPEMIYIVFKQVSWTDNDRIFDGDGSDSGGMYQKDSSPNIKVIAGAPSNANANLVVNTFGIIRLLFNGASSKLQVNETVAVTGNFGANNMGGFTLGQQGGGVLRFGNIQVKEIILRKIADAAGDEQDIYDYLENKYGL